MIFDWIGSFRLSSEFLTDNTKHLISKVKCHKEDIFPAALLSWVASIDAEFFSFNIQYLIFRNRYWFLISESNQYIYLKFPMFVSSYEFLDFYV